MQALKQMHQYPYVRENLRTLDPELVIDMLSLSMQNIYDLATTSATWSPTNTAVSLSALKDPDNYSISQVAMLLIHPAKMLTILSMKRK